MNRFDNNDKYVNKFPERFFIGPKFFNTYPAKI